MFSGRRERGQCQRTNTHSEGIRGSAPRGASGRAHPPAMATEGSSLPLADSYADFTTRRLESSCRERELKSHFHSPATQQAPVPPRAPLTPHRRLGSRWRHLLLRVGVSGNANPDCVSSLGWSAFGGSVACGWWKQRPCVSHELHPACGRKRGLLFISKKLQPPCILSQYFLATFQMRVTRGLEGHRSTRILADFTRGDLKTVLKPVSVRG